jgi:ureidoacrylate peracid hydrolase
VQEASWGAEWFAELASPREDEAVVEKPAYDGFNQSRLDQTLKHLDVRTCVYVGFASNVCVEATARHGFEKGYYTVLLWDASAGDSPAAHELCRAMWRSFYGPVLAVAELRASWNG